MQAAFHAELDELIGDLARMGRLATQIMINASAALLEADRVLADLVIARADELDRQHHDVEQRCTTLLAPVAGDLPAVVATLHALGDLQRMGHLAQHTAQIARHAHPHLAVPDEVRPVIARLSLLACGLAQQAATAIEKLDPLPDDRLARADEEIDALLRQLLRTLFAENWSHGLVPATRTALIGRYYERFASHAVAIAGQVSYLATGRTRSHHPVALRKTAPVGV
ncbi:MAG: phosphate signaling complex PhoU family protein [Pseudonocardiaceae bacterium]